MTFDKDRKNTSRRERRRSRRTRKREIAWIEADRGPVSSCVICDRSDTGARLQVHRPRALPDRFNLLTGNEGSIRHLCEVVWRGDTQVGVRFSPEERNRVPGPLRPVSDMAGVLKLGGFGAGEATRSRASGDLQPSSLALLGCAFLGLATLTLYVANSYEASALLAKQVCETAAVFCEHPEMTGGGSILLGFLYLIIRGMEV